LRARRRRTKNCTTTSNEHADTGDEHEHERERRRAGLVVVAALAGCIAVEVGGSGKDLVVHRRRRLPQVRGATGNPCALFA
jgi:hypothetical protein